MEHNRGHFMWYRGLRAHMDKDDEEQKGWYKLHPKYNKGHITVARTKTEFDTIFFDKVYIPEREQSSTEALYWYGYLILNVHGTEDKEVVLAEQICGLKFYRDIEWGLEKL